MDNRIHFLIFTPNQKSTAMFTLFFGFAQAVILVFAISLVSVIIAFLIDWLISELTELDEIKYKRQISESARAYAAMMQKYDDPNPIKHLPKGIKIKGSHA